MFVVDINKSYHKFADLYGNLLYMATTCKANERRAKWGAFYDFKRQNMLANTFDIQIDYGDDEVRKAKVTKDLDYGYCLSVHKSQGSTYDNVFINLNDILRCRTILDRNRLLYVALSRASKKVFIYNSL